MLAAVTAAVAVVAREDWHLHRGAVPHARVVLHVRTALRARAPYDVARLHHDRLEAIERQWRFVSVLAEDDGVAGVDERPAACADDDPLELLLLFAVDALAFGATPDQLPEREPDECHLGVRLRFGTGDGEHELLGDPVAAGGPNVDCLLQNRHIRNDLLGAPYRTTSPLVDGVCEGELFSHFPFFVVVE